MASVILKRVRAGNVAQALDLKVPSGTLERLQISPEGVERTYMRVEDRLADVLAQYQMA